MNKYTKDEIRQLVNECISRLKEECNLTENRVVTFGRKTYPQFGWCVFLAGSGGVGKGNSLNYNIPINGKVINVDHWKKFYAQMQGVEYHPDDSEQVAWAHKGVDFHPNKDRLPNIIIDATAKNPYHDVLDIAQDAQDLGYKTMLVWVVATRSESIIRNLKRSRHVPDYILHFFVQEEEFLYLFLLLLLLC